MHLPGSGDNLSDTGRESIYGGVYGLYIFNQLSTGRASETRIETTLYHTMSTWNPYNSMLMKTTVRRRVPPVIYVGARATNCVSTADPGGADALVESGTSGERSFGNTQAARVKNPGYPPGNTARKAWLRFPLNPSALQRITSATLRLTVSCLPTTAIPLTYNVHGLRSWAKGQARGETNLTWNNAPASDTNDSSELDLYQAIFPGSFTTSTNRAIGTTASFSSRMLTDFLNQSPTGAVTGDIRCFTSPTSWQPIFRGCAAHAKLAVAGPPGSWPVLTRQR